MRHYFKVLLRHLDVLLALPLVGIEGYWLFTGYPEGLEELKGACLIVTVIVLYAGKALKSDDCDEELGPYYVMYGFLGLLVGASLLGWLLYKAFVNGQEAVLEPRISGYVFSLVIMILSLLTMIRGWKGRKQVLPPNANNEKFDQ